MDHQTRRFDLFSLYAGNLTETRGLTLSREEFIKWIMMKWDGLQERVAARCHSSGALLDRKSL